MKRSALFLSLLAAACGGGDEPTGGSTAPVTCADPTKVVALPTPGWQRGTMLSPPEGELAAALLGEARPTWAEQVPLVDGWPQRPTIVLPLDGPASGADASRIAAWAVDGGAAAELEVVFDVLLTDDGTGAVVQPRDPFPAGAREIVVAVGEGAFAGARALPACGADGAPDPAYATAAGALPAGAGGELALPLRLATTHEELARLWDRLSAAPVLTVAEIEARALDSFGEAAPPPEVAALLAPTAASGILELPAYADADGIFHSGADGAPEAVATTRPGFVVALPAAGSAPYPFVLFQHGGGQNKTDFFQLAGPLADAGFAFVAIDLPLHGDRSVAGGSDFEFVDFESLARTRDNFRQAVADHMAVFTGVSSLNDALAPVLGVPAALDPSRGFYMGLSLGGISGSMTFATTPDVQAAALFVGAGGYPEIVAKGVFSIFVNDLLGRPAPERQALLGLAEVILDGADPLAYALRVEDRSAPPRPALFLQAIADPVVSEPASDQWARAFGADLARPFQHPVPGMDEPPLPTADNFAFEAGGPAATRALVQCPMNEVPASSRHGGLIVQGYSQEMVAHCFSSLLATGSCELVDTGFADH